jgi:5-methylcytosine-specific restriction endonuclease McrA
MAKRDYAQATAYEDSPKQVKMREARNKARKEYEKKHGDLPRTQDVDHIKPLSKKGKPLALSNLRAVSEAENRSFSRTKTGELKSQISKRERAKVR